MKISYRIAGGYISVFMLLIMVAAFGWTALDSVGKRSSVALAAQSTTADIETLLARSQRFMADADPATERSVMAMLTHVRQSIAGLEAKGARPELVAALNEAIDVFTGHLETFGQREKAKTDLTVQRRDVLDAILRIATKMRPVQETRVKEARGALTQSRDAIRQMDTAHQILDLVTRQMGKLRDAQTAWLLTAAPRRRDDMVAAMKSVESMSRIAMTRFPSSTTAAKVGPALEAWKAALGATPTESTRLNDAFDGAQSALDAMTQELANSRSHANQILDQNQDSLERANQLLIAAMTASDMTNRTRAAEAIIDGRSPSLDLFDDLKKSVEELKNSADLLLYWTSDDDIRAELKDLLTRIDGYGANLDAFAAALATQTTLAQQVMEASSRATDVAQGARDGEILALNGERSTAGWWLGLAVLLALVVGAGMAWGIGRGITRPLDAIVRVMESLAQGNTDLDIPGRDRRDELRNVARAVEVFRDNAREMNHLNREREQSKVKAEEDRRKTMRSLADALDSQVSGVISSIADAVRTFHDAATGLSNDAEGASRETSAVAEAVRESSATIRAMATTSEQLAASVNEISAKIVESSRISTDAAEEARRTNTLIENLAEAAEQIGGVVQLIQDVASQTNLLALNATIEAARAGEAGKGFAVVANEVKSLANQTEKATNDITRRVQDIQRGANTAVDAIRGIDQTMSQISEIISTIASAMTEQTAATEEISRGAQQAANGTEAITHSTDMASQIAKGTSESAGKMLDVSADLGNRTGALSTAVNDFLRAIRTT